MERVAVIDELSPISILEHEGCRIIRGDSRALPPVEILTRNKRIRPRDKEFLGRFVREAQQFLEQPTIFDDFGPDHTQRRTWCKSIGEKYGSEVLDYLRRNKIRTNTISSFIAAFEIAIGIINGAKLYTPEAIHLREIYAKLPLNELIQYDRLSRVGKVRLVRHLEGICREVLAVFPATA